ncbi:hypothetical protein PybrP1_007716 [[Pythium] brassicae (nom. inval.)]|nr:hypothetical protein PybrP1_007716 [[Pythium] brassicae (nom. inval.)]
MKVVEFAVPSPSEEAASGYHLGLDVDGAAYPPGSGAASSSHDAHAAAQQPPTSHAKVMRRINTFTGAAPEEEQRNIISLRYRADSMADSIASENEASAEAKVWNVFERVFWFLKGMTIYQARRRLKFTIVTQSVINTSRIFPIILGLSYQATLPVLILFLLFYKFGMQLSLLVDIIWYFKGYNGKLNSVSSGTAVLMQGFFSILLTLLNLAGLLYGWKLRRIVKAVQNQREYNRAALATMAPPSPAAAARGGSMHHLRQTMSVNPAADLPEDERPSARRTIVVEPGLQRTTSRRKSLAAGVATTGVPAEVVVAPAPFCGNMIRTSKYTFYNFPFVFFKMQFSRLANIYTTIVVGLCFFSFSPVSPVASLTPLLIVFATSALKDVSEDLRRQKADAQVNTKAAHIVRRDASGVVRHMDGMWQDIEVGDLLLLKDGDEVPADCVLLATSRPDGRCYVETANLDGETNLKIRSVAKPTKHFLTPDDILNKFKIHVECDAPNKDLFYFDGVLKLTDVRADDPTTSVGASADASPDAADPGAVTAATTAVTTPTEDTSLTMDNLILRGSDSRNAEWTIAFVIYTGKETKIAMNSSDVPLKRSFVEKTLDTMFVLVLVLLFGISVACTLGNNDWDFDLNDGNAPWYIGQSSENGYIFLSYVILFNNLIPLSMYVTMEGVRFVHARYIESDLEIANHSTKREITDFLLLLTICNTVIPEYESSSGAEPESKQAPVKYNAASPDEQALVLAAADLGFVLTGRDGPICETLILGQPMTRKASRTSHAATCKSRARDKASLRAKLEDLYVDLVDDKWGSDEHSSAVSVLYEAFKRVFLIGWDLAKTVVVGRDEQADARKKRRRAAARREEHQQQQQHGDAAAAVESTPTDSRTHFDEVYPALNVDIALDAGLEHGHCDRQFEPKNDLQSVATDEFADEDLEFAMVIDGKTLALVLEDDIKYLFLSNRSFNWITFFGWCGLGMWHAYVIYAVPFFSNGFIVWYFAHDSDNGYLFGSRDLGLWADGVAAYTYLITASTLQVALMTSNWTRANTLSTIGTLVFYYLFMAFFCNLYGWTHTEFYETENGYGVLSELFSAAWFWFGLLVAVIAAVLPNFIAKAGRVLFYPEPSHLMREWNRMAKNEDAAVAVESPRLVRRNTGFAFSHFPGEGEMAMSSFRATLGRPSFSALQPSLSTTSTAEESSASTKRSSPTPTQRKQSK